MANILLGFLILSNVFAKGFCRDYEVHYEVNDFDELTETRLRIRHDVMKRSLSRANLTTSASPLTSTMTTPVVTTIPKASSTTRNVSAKTTDQLKPSKIPTHSPVLPTTPASGNNTNRTDTNITSYQDNHKYFTSHYYPSGERWWFDLNVGSGTPKLHLGLTKNLQYSDTIKTTFTFPYYGHEIDEVTITNKGFLFLGHRLHKFNTSMQYVAPLMADFGAHLHNKTSIHYVDTGDRFTVEWKNLKLQNQPESLFSFQCSILKNGTIVFAYNNISMAVSKIKNDTFPVRVGLSDGFVLQYVRHGIFIIDGKLYIRIRYIVYYRYHQVKFQQERVKSGSAFVLTPLPNCILFKSCDSCVNSKTQFSCRWCPRLKRCSDGIDRHRHSWLYFGCDKNSVTTCPKIRTTASHSPASTHSPTQSHATGGNKSNQKTKSRGDSSSNKRAGIAVLIVLCVLIFITIACWVAYAYTHPLSRSGMLLMQYGNPRKWCKNSGSAGSSSGGKITFKSMPHDSTA